VIGAVPPKLECLHLATRVEPDTDLLLAGKSDGKILMWRLQDANRYGGSKRRRVKVRAPQAMRGFQL
jgi:hypothetical protein